MGWPGDLTLKEIGDLGVRRVSVGGALARSAWGGFMRAAKMIAEQGRFDGFAARRPEMSSTISFIVRTIEARNCGLSLRLPLHSDAERPA